MNANKPFRLETSQKLGSRVLDVVDANPITCMALIVAIAAIALMIFFL